MCVYADELSIEMDVSINYNQISTNHPTFSYIKLIKFFKRIIGMN